MLTKRFLLIFGILFVAATVFWIPGPASLSYDLQAGLACLIFAAGFFIFEPIAIQVSALLIPVTFVATGLIEVREAFRPFADPVVFLILGSLIIAEALRKHNLTRKLASRLLIYSRGNPRFVLISIMGVGAFTSMWIFSTAVVAMLIPVCLTIGGRVEEDEHRDQFTRVLLISLALATTLGGLSTILGASSNAVASGVLSENLAWSFLDWMKYGFPLSMMAVFLAGTLIILTVFPDQVTIAAEDLFPDEESEPLFTSKQLITLAILGAAILAWLFSPLIPMLFPIPPGLTESAIIGLVAASLLFISNVITWKDARHINWGVYLIIGGGLSLGNGLIESGVTQMFAVQIQHVVGAIPYPVVAGLLIVLSALASNAVNNTTVVAIFAPLLSTTAIQLNLSPLQLVLPMAFGATFGFLLPCASSRMALISTAEVVDSKDMLKIGGIVTPPLVVLTLMYFYLLFLMGWLQ